MKQRALRLPEQLDEIIAEIAQREHRSVNSQMVVLLETAVASQPTTNGKGL